MENFRNDRATKLLGEAKDYSKTHPDDPWTYKDKLTSITTSYRGTPAETEATAILADLKLPGPRPIPKVDTRNLAADSSFESGTFGAWFPWGAPSIATDNAHTGKCCLRLNAGQNGASQEIKNLKPGATYVVYAWGKITAGNALQLGIRKYGGNETGAPVTQEQYQRVSAKFTMGANSTSAEVYFYKGSGTGCVYIDDVYVLPDGAPPPE
jgi:chitinase